MGNVTTLPVSPAAESVLDAYLDTISAGYNNLIDVGRFDRESAQMMVGFFSAATITFRALCNEGLAAQFERAANDLRYDWRSFPRVIPALYEAIKRDRQRSGQ